ncbi:MAG TPA: hypothetical protein DD435_01455 [Cyanobacteria bacterium UBA8530]|nr:hypothetical protein [Cyanobacteria bacterium UBA8530]
MKKTVGIALLAGLVGLATLGACSHQAMNSPQAAYRVMSGDPSGISGLVGIHGITAQQKEQLKAIAQKYRPAPDTLKARFVSLKGLLLADPFDPVEFEAALQAHVSERDARLKQHLPALSEMRFVLTEEQKTKLAATLEQKPQMRGHFDGMRKKILGRLSGDLKLTDAQRSQFEAIASKLHDSETMKIHRTALVDFVRSGDQGKLEASMKEVRLPSEDLVSLVSSLDRGQRTALVDHLERFMGNRHPLWRH